MKPWCGGRRQGFRIGLMGRRRQPIAVSGPGGTDRRAPSSKGTALPWTDAQRLRGPGGQWITGKIATPDAGGRRDIADWNVTATVISTRPQTRPTTAVAETRVAFTPPIVTVTGWPRPAGVGWRQRHRLTGAKSVPFRWRTTSSCNWGCRITRAVRHLVRIEGGSLPSTGIIRRK